MKLINKEQDDWDLYIDGVLFSYRASIQKSTNELMFLWSVKCVLHVYIIQVILAFIIRKPILPIEMEMKNGRMRIDQVNVNKYMEKMTDMKKENETNSEPKNFDHTLHNSTYFHTHHNMNA